MTTNRVLIVDDQSEVRRVLRAALETLGGSLKIVEVPSGEEALLVVTRQPFDLLIADIRLPGISGLELKDRARKRSPEMHLILITGMTDYEIRQKVAQAGADAYFFKPIDIPAFLDTVQKLLGIVEPGLGLTASLQEAVDEAPPRPARLQTGELDHFLRKRLAVLHHQTEAVCVALLDDQGQVLAQAGEASRYLNEPELTASLALVCKAAAGVGIKLDSGVPYDFISFFVPSWIYCLTHVGYTVGLLAVVRGAEWDPERQWKLQRLMREAVLDMREAHPDWVAPNTPPDSIPATPSEALTSVVEDSAAIQSELDSIFAQANPGQSNPQELDAFWESALDQSDSLSGDADGISFEQARQMGLAPKDD
jgi:CheY-like chemotaxis protein